MKVYISNKSSTFRNWVFLILSPLVFIGSLYILYRHFADGIHHQQGDIMGALLWLYVSAFLYYSAVEPGILLVDGDNIILHGIFKDIVYQNIDFKEFRRIRRYFFRTWFEIAFKDGKSYWFECEANNSRAFNMFMDLDRVIPDLNEQLEEAINLNKRDDK